MLKSKITLLLLLSFGLFVTSCGDDDSGDCVVSDWVGTYTGTQVCNGASLPVTVTITASGTEQIVVMYETDGLETEFDPLTPTNCDLDVSESQGSLSLTVDANLDGDQLSFQDVLSDGTNNVDCTITATRQ